MILLSSTVMTATNLYLFSTHINTPKKIIAMVAVGVVIVAAGVVWLVRRRRSRA